MAKAPVIAKIPSELDALIEDVLGGEGNDLAKAADAEVAQAATVSVRFATTVEADSASTATAIATAAQNKFDQLHTTLRTRIEAEMAAGAAWLASRAAGK